MNVAYVLYGKYKNYSLDHHKSMILKLQETYTVTVFLISNYGETVNIDATRLKVSDMTVLEGLYSGLLQVPPMDYLYIVEIGNQSSLSPHESSVFCKDGIVWLRESDRLEFMINLKDKTIYSSLEEFGLSEVRCETTEINKPSGIEGEVCVIGNGPLSYSEREEIARCHKIVRFNDTKNRLPSERCDIHIMRRHDVHPSYTDNYPVSYHDGVSKVILIGSNASSTDVLKDFVIQRHNYKQPFDREDYISFPDRPKDLFSVFSKCNTSEIGNSVLKKISNHPSLGMIALSILEDMDSVNRLHIYGMNFNFFSAHGKVEQTVITQCCSKCLIHETERSRYIPVNDVSFFTVVSLVIILILLTIFIFAPLNELR